MKERLVEKLDELMKSISNPSIKPMISLLSNKLFRPYLTNLNDKAIEELLQYVDDLVYYVRYGVEHGPEA